MENVTRSDGNRMVTNNEFQRIRTSKEAESCALELLVEQSKFEKRSEFLDAAFKQFSESLGARQIVLVQMSHGEWTTVASHPNKSNSAPLRLLGNVLDADQVQSEENWAAAPLLRKSTENQILAVELKSANIARALPLVDAFAATIGLALSRIDRRKELSRRVRRLEAILEIAGQWTRNLEMESLLTQMAETSTRLLGAERASIFLWDRTNKILVGRPALGVEENELRIPDNTGIVGEVVQTGEIRRVDEQAQGSSIDRSVDKQLGFQTRTLLCVPLRGDQGKVLGAFEMINKRDGNFTVEDEVGLTELASHAAIALENTQQFRQLLDSRKQMADQAAEGAKLIGQTTVLNNLRATIERVAKTDLSLLVLGENGTGKEVVSRMVHYMSDRRDEPFVAVNCAALTETLLESELFGHEKGAFTDAHESRAGKFELASGGTLFLDEIGDLSLGGQAKLLRVLEEKIVVRVGGSVPISTNARVVAATNQDLAEMVQARKFREDLFFRLNVVTVEMPALRERADDIVLLAEHFLKDFSIKARRQPPQLTPDAIKRLRQHAWPGNVRELRNLMERLAYLSQGDTIESDDLAFIMAPKGDATGNISLELSLTDATKKFQNDYIRKHIELAGGNMSDAAKKLGLHRSNLYRKMRQLDMHVQEDEDNVA